MSSKPVHNKVSVGLAWGSPAAVITWALTTFIPAWHSGIPDTLARALPGFVGVAAYFWASWSAKDDSRFAVDARQLALEAARDLEQLMPQPAPTGAAWQSLEKLPGTGMALDPQQAPTDLHQPATGAGQPAPVNAYQAVRAHQPGTAGSMHP